MSKKINTKKSAFTLIELLVVMSILILVTLGINFSLDLNNTKTRVEISTKILASDIKRARDLTLNRKINTTCVSLYGENARGQCLRYKIVLNYNNANTYLLLPQIVDHTDTSIIAQHFPDAVLKLEEGASILEPSSSEVISFDYAPGDAQTIEIITSYSADERTCDDPSGIFPPIVITDTKGNHRAQIQFDCRGRIFIQEENE